VKIQKLIDTELLAEQEKRLKRERSGKWGPHKFGRCYRFQYWSRKNLPTTNPPDIEALRRFKVGHLFHKYVQTLLKNCETEVEVNSTEHDVHGFADVVFKNEVTDIKSVRSYLFKLFKKKDYDVTVDKFGAWLQVMSYAMFLKKEKGRLIFIDKDAMQSKEYTEKLVDWKDKVLEELDILNGYWKQDKLPPAIPRAYNGKECKYCGFKETCDKAEGKCVS